MFCRSSPNRRTLLIHLGVPQALDEFGDINRALDDAYNRNDAAAAAALFTEDAVLLAPDGMFSGRQHIEERYAHAFQRSPNVDFNCSRDRFYLNAIDNMVWSAGQYRGQAGPVFEWGYWSAIYVREGDTWKIARLPSVSTNNWLRSQLAATTKRSLILSAGILATHPPSWSCSTSSSAVMLPRDTKAGQPGGALPNWLKW